MSDIQEVELNVRVVFRADDTVSVYTSGSNEHAPRELLGSYDDWQQALEAISDELDYQAGREMFYSGS